MRLVEARDRSIITHAAYLAYKARGYADGDEIGLNTATPTDPDPTDIDFQTKQGINVADGVLEDDVASVSNVRLRVAKVSFDYGDEGAIPVLVTTVPIILFNVLLLNTQEFDGTLEFGVAADHDKFAGDTQFDKTVNTEPAPILLGYYVASGATLNMYLGAGTTGVGDVYLSYIRLPT